MQHFTYKGKTHQIDASQEAYLVYDDVAEALAPDKGTFADEDAFYEKVDQITLRLIAKTPARD